MRLSTPTGGAPGLVYAWLDLGWPAEEALGLVAHVDGRGVRAPVIWQGTRYDTPREVSARTGVPIVTLQSRLHRQRSSGRHVDTDLAEDMRGAGGSRTTRAAIRLPATMPVADLHAALARRSERRILLDLKVAPGTMWHGGVTEPPPGKWSRSHHRESSIRRGGSGPAAGRRRPRLDRTADTSRGTASG